MRLSHERCVHLSHLFVNALEDEESVEFLLDPNDIRLRMLQILEAELLKEDELEEAIRRKIASQKREVPEGSAVRDDSSETPSNLATMQSRRYSRQATSVSRSPASMFGGRRSGTAGSLTGLVARRKAESVVSTRGGRRGRRAASSIVLFSALAAGAWPCRRWRTGTTR